MYVNINKKEGYMSEPGRKTKSEQREATRRALIKVGRAMFTHSGYAQTATEDIVQRAGVTRGALYHHFSHKEGLFKAVLEEVQQEVAGNIEKAASQHDGRWEQLVSGCRAFLVAGIDPEVQQIMLIDAPAVLGWETWRQMDASTSMKSLKEILALLIAEGIIRPQPLDALTHLLSGAMNEAVLWIARAQEPEQALTEATATLETLLEALRSQGNFH
jgi:AcrR family transcriptional regulator